MSQKWNLQDIRPTSTARPAMRETPIRRPQQDIIHRPQPIAEEASVIDPDIDSLEIIDGNNAKRNRVIITSTIAAVILVAGYFVNVLLGGADVTVYPKVKNVSVQANFTAYTSPALNMLGYELLTLEASGEKQVKASNKEKVSEKAEGKIFIYNTQTTASQRLIKNTRFETKDGLVFRIKESVEIPKATKDAKGTIAPGTASADVFSDGTGEKYNVTPQRFSVPGLKGSDQYDSVYAESTTQFSGGFEGEKFIIDEQELNTAKQALHVELRDTLLARLKTERPAGFIIYDDSITFAFDTLPAADYGNSLATIKEKARLQVPMFKEVEFSEFIAESTVPEYTGEPITLTDPKTLTFTYVSSTTTVSDIANNTSLNFLLKGSTQLVWKFDEMKLQSDLVSMKRTDASRILGSYSAIREAKADVRPFWKSEFPSDPKEIVVHTVIQEKESAQ